MPPDSICGRWLRKVLEAGHFQQVHRALARRRLRQRQDVGRQQHILEHARPGKQHVVLEHDADFM